jgi:hypothetical protein
MRLSGLNLVAGAAVIVIGAATIVAINRNSIFPEEISAGQGGPPPTSQPETVHSASWYVAHPDIAKQDEEKCGGDAGTIPQAACQNVESAEEQLLAQGLAQAAATNSNTSSSPAKTP